jgi:phosphatidate cytidylyltransferase
MASDLGRRIGVAAVGIPLCVAVTLLGGLPFALGLGVLAGVAAWEIGRMLVLSGRNFLPVPAILFAASLPSAVLIGWEGTWIIAIIALLAISGAATLRFRPSQRPFQTGALTAVAGLYVGGLLSFGVALREPVGPPELRELQGTLLFFLPVAVTWLADTAAYFGGKVFGSRKLAPAISPNKTVEGAISCLIAGPVGVLVYAAWILPDLGGQIGLWWLVLLGLLVSGAAIAGDLVESGLKRECGVKDSSNLLPGHGGLLDRMDSLLWSIPVAYFFLSAVI